MLGFDLLLAIVETPIINHDTDFFELFGCICFKFWDLMILIEGHGDILLLDKGWTAFSLFFVTWTSLP